MIKRLLILLPILFLAIFFFYPLASITARGLAPQGVIDLSAFGKIAGSEFYRETLWFTFWQAAISTMLTILAAFPAAYVMARYTFRGKSLIGALTLIPFVMPTVIVAAGFMALIGPRGWVNEALKALLNVDYAPLDIQNTIWIILLAHVFYNFAVALRLISGFWSNLDPQITQAARVLGASRWRAFREVTLPLLRPAIFAAALLVFIFDFTSFGVILILGGPQFNTIETAIYRKTLIDFDLPLATALALVQLGLHFRHDHHLHPTTKSRRGAARSAFAPDHAATTDHMPRQSVAAGRHDLHVEFAAAAAGGVDCPIVRGEQYAVFRQLSQPSDESAWFGVVRAAIDGVGQFAAVCHHHDDRGVDHWDSGGVCCRRKDSLVTSQRTNLGLAAGRLCRDAGFRISDRLSDAALVVDLIPLAHSLVAFPFVVRTITPALRSIRSNLREAAQVMGADPSRVWREVDLPILGRAMLIGGAFAFAVSLGEFGATAMLARAEMPTLPYAIFRYLSQPGSLNYGQAMAMSTVLMLVVALSLVAIDRFRIGEIGEF